MVVDREVQMMASGFGSWRYHAHVMLETGAQINIPVRKARNNGNVVYFIIFTYMVVLSNTIPVKRGRRTPSRRKAKEQINSTSVLLIKAAAAERAHIMQIPIRAYHLCTLSCGLRLLNRQ